MMMQDAAKRFCLGIGIGTLAHVPLEKFSQWRARKKLNESIDISQIDRDVKIQCLCLGILLAPIYEEILYRGLLQGVILQKVSQRIFAPQFSKLAQVILSSILFAYPHPNQECAFLLGLQFGIIKESKLRIAGSIGAHMGNNFQALRPFFL
jgi:hypothetical protein